MAAGSRRCRNLQKSAVFDDVSTMRARAYQIAPSRQRRNLMPGSKSDAALALAGLSLAIEGDLNTKVDRLTKLVHILWKDAERLESIVQVIPEGLRIKAGISEILVLKNGGIKIDGQRTCPKTPGKSEFYF